VPEAIEAFRGETDERHDTQRDEQRRVRTDGPDRVGHGPFHGRGRTRTQGWIGADERGLGHEEPQPDRVAELHDRAGDDGEPQVDRAECCTHDDAGEDRRLPGLRAAHIERARRLFTDFVGDPRDVGTARERVADTPHDLRGQHHGI
jgi:hypothetical protein